MYRKETEVRESSTVSSRLKTLAERHDRILRGFVTTTLAEHLRKALPPQNAGQAVMNIQYDENIATGDRIYLIGPLPESITTQQVEAAMDIHCACCHRESHPCRYELKKEWFPVAGTTQHRHAIGIRLYKRLSIPMSYAQMRSALFTLLVLLLAIWLLKISVVPLIRIWGGQRLPTDVLLTGSSSTWQLDGA